MDDAEKPVTIGDLKATEQRLVDALAATEQRLVEQMRDMQTELLRGFPLPKEG